MAKLGINKKIPPSAHKGKLDALVDVMSKEDYLTGTVANARVDLDKRIHKGVKKLADSTECITPLADGQVKVKSVSMRMLMTEALLDLFAKYEAGEGLYPLDPDEDWSWTKKGD